jgi:hypothetical protein
MSRTDLQEPGAAPTAAGGDRVTGRVAWLAGVIAVSLAVTSGLHLSGLLDGRAAPFDADHAGIAEALIGVVLAVAAAGLARSGRGARQLGLYGFGFAIAGFGVGLSMTSRGGHWPDIAYHLTVLPLLIGCFLVLLRVPRTRGRQGSS